MPISLATLLRKLPPWGKLTEADGDIVLCSVVRLVRNLKGHAFPGWTDSVAARSAVVDQVLPVLKRYPGCQEMFDAGMEQLGKEYKRYLALRKQLTPCMAARGEGCHLAIPYTQDKIFMINEEEHIVVHFYQEGLNLEQPTKKAEACLAYLRKHLPLAEDPTLGALTSIPEERGDGLQFYIAMHLPLLGREPHIQAIHRALEQLGFNLSPYYSDQQDTPTGAIYILTSPPAPLGKSQEMSGRLSRVASRLKQREQQLRSQADPQSLLERRDEFGRAYGLLRYAERLSFQEMSEAFSCITTYASICPLPTGLRLQLQQKLRDLSIQLSPSCLAAKSSPCRDFKAEIKRSQTIRKKLQLEQLLSEAPSQ